MDRSGTAAFDSGICGCPCVSNIVLSVVFFRTKHFKFRHAPQYGFMGLGVGLPLLQWLDKYTFPFESRFSDLGFAKEMYSAAVVCSLDSHRSLLHPNFRINTRTQQQQTLNRHVICATEQHFGLLCDNTRRSDQGVDSNCA